jgi:hypothetical protein
MTSDTVTARTISSIRCPHRMVCAKCQYYRPKGSSEAQILEAKKNLLRLRQEIPLRDDEISAIRRWC